MNTEFNQENEIIMEFSNNFYDNCTVLYIYNINLYIDLNVQY